MSTRAGDALREPEGNLMLVNAGHGCTRTPAMESLVRVGPESDGVWMERRAAALLEQLMGRIHGWRQIAAVSGWRSRAEQSALWDESLRENGMEFTKQYVARPGCSEHETGLAIDLGLRGGDIDKIRPDFPWKGVCGQFRRLAASYGFVQRYPAGKAHITGIAPEPWHFRYVGIPHGEIMETLSLTLEEYLAALRQYPLGRAPFLFRSGAFRFAVGYLPEEEYAAAALPPACLVSGDNDGGIIVTAWDTKEEADGLERKVDRPFPGQ